MICPLQKTIIGKDRDNIDIPYFGECLHEICAWWDEKRKQCCIKTLAQLKVSGSVNTHPN